MYLVYDSDSVAPIRSKTMQMRLADRVDVRPFNGKKKCESLGCVRRALWRLEFSGEIPTLLANANEPTVMFACGACARSITDGLRQDSALIVFYLK